MEELLRTYARKRREDAGQPEMHPATRRLLQGEVAELRRQAGSGRTPRAWLFLHWPRVGFALGMFILLGVVLWNSLPERNRISESRFAKQDAPAASGEDRSAKAAPAGPTPNESDAMNLRQRALNEPALAKGFQAAPVSAKPLGEDAVVLERKIGQRDETGGATDSAPLGLTLQPPRSAPENESLVARSDKDRPLSASLADRYDAGQGRPDGLSITRAQELPSGNSRLYFAEGVKALVETTPSKAGGFATRGGEQMSEAATAAGKLGQSGVSLAATDPVGKPPVTGAGPGLETRVKQIAPDAAARALAKDAKLPADEVFLRAPTAPNVPPLAVAQQPAPRFRAAVPAAEPGASAGAAGAAPAPLTTLQFIRAESEKEKAATAGVALSAFSIEQRGDIVRVIDKDGSVYSGRMLSSTEAAQLRLAEPLADSRGVPVSGAIRGRLNGLDAVGQQSQFVRGISSPTNIVFRVSGTNRSSGRQVTLEAAFFAGDADGGRNGYRADSARTARRQTAAELFRAPAGIASNSAAFSRLVGRFRIDGSNETRIIAVPAAK